MNSSVDRILVFDFIKFVAIFLVLYGHCEQHLVNVNRLENSVYNFIYSFHMPLFMMVSGYFSISSYKLDAASFFIKKAKSLLIPVFTFSFCISIFYYYSQYGLYFNLISFCSLLIENLNTWLWFLKALFLCFIVLFCAIKVPKVGIFLSLILMFFVPYLNLAVLYPAFVLGYHLRTKNILLKPWNSKCLIFPCIFFILVCFYDTSLKNIMPIEDIFSLMVYTYKQLYRIILGLIGSFSLVYLLVKFFYSRTEGFVYKKLCSFGQYTLEIYVFQCIILEMLLPMFIKMPFAYKIWCDILIFPFISIIIVGLGILISSFIKRSFVLNLLFFGK